MLLVVKAFHCGSVEIDFMNFNVDRDAERWTYLFGNLCKQPVPSMLVFSS
jgi:hypothetical protein